MLKTAKFDAMNAFYKTLLLAEPMFEGPIGAFLTYDDEHHRVFLLDDPGATPRDPRAAGLAHFAYLMSSFADLMSAYVRLKGEGIMPGYCVNHGFQISFYYRDPDGNEAELGCDCFDTRDELAAWFATGVFANDQFGFIVDPEALLAHHERGESAADILRDSYQEAYA